MKVKNNNRPLFRDNSYLYQNSYARAQRRRLAAFVVLVLLVAAIAGVVMGIRSCSARKQSKANADQTAPLNSDAGVAADQNGDAGDAHAGESDVATDVVEKSSYKKPKLIREGHGVLIEVTDPGAIGLTVKTYDASTNATISVDKRVKKQPVTIQVSQANKVRPKVVALTFDDGPNPGETTSILKVLAAADVKATFFMLGRNVKTYPDLTRAVAEGGHQIAIHGYSHDSLAKMKPPKIESELLESVKAVKDAADVDVTWMRPPYGAVNSMVYSLLGEHKLKVALWDVDPVDYGRPGASVIASRVVKRVHPGAVVLMHDGGGDRTQTVKALKTIIKKLKKKGYRFVTIDQMYQLIGQQSD
ncbi:MAG: polysaccharide deacetylase family protein [Actinomycetes bacterium]|jgi:peptidoglycan/xylan/chitin deacetylase (PgdA/CDA1 family)|nr:polysaccharide deacetylase family protein [Actinomycetes bacterium]